MTSAMTDEQLQFKDPPVMYRPVPFWSWNEQLEADEVRRQLRLLAEAGYGGAFMHSRTGLLTPYLGEQWFDAIAVVIDECRTLGLKIWLYDEDTWPSGFSGGSVPRTDPLYRPMAIFAARVGDSVPPLAVPVGEPCRGLQIYQYTEPLGNPRFNGTTYINPLHRQAVACFIREAYESYHQRFSQHYGSLIPATFTDEPSAFSLATALPIGGVPFAPELPEHHRLLHGEDPLPLLHLLFIDDPQAAAFRVRYYRTANDLFTRHFTRQLADWCEQHHITFTGHYVFEEKLLRQQSVGTVVAGQYRYMHIPGIDHLGLQVRERVTAKVCQGAVNQFAKPRMLSELYGAAGQHLSPADRLWIGRQQAALGVNLFVPHLALYTMAGCRKRDYPANLFYQQPWWPLTRLVEDDLSRLALTLSQGRYVADVLLLHPAESVFVPWRSRVYSSGEPSTPMVHHHTIDDDARALVEAIDQHLAAMVNLLLGERIGFDVGEEGALHDLGQIVQLDGGTFLQVGAMRYRVVLLPHMLTIRPTIFALLRRFTAAGGMVLRSADGPTLLDGAPDSDLQSWVAALPRYESDALVDVIRSIAPQPVHFQPDPACGEATRRLLWAHVRELADGQRRVYLVNLSRTHDIVGTLHITGHWAGALKLDTQTGQCDPLAVSEHQPDHVAVKLHLPPIHHLLLDLSPLQSTPLPTVMAEADDLTDLDFASARVERLDDNALILDTARWREGDGPWSVHPLPVIAIQQRLNALRYHGPVTLRFPLRVGNLAGDRSLRLVIEHPERYLIRVNQQKVAYDGLPFWRDIRWLPIDITGLLRSGDNVIELHCPDFHFGDPTSFDDPAARYGTEIESLFLVGDFSVQGRYQAESIAHPTLTEADAPTFRRFIFEAASLQVVEPGLLQPGDVTTQGLPFYAGRLRLTVPLPLTGPGANYRIRSFDAAGLRIAIGDRIITDAALAPVTFRLDAPAAPSANLRITLYGTLRNLLGPHHHPGPELRFVGPAHFTPWPSANQYQATATIAQAALDWAAGGHPPETWNCNYHVMSFGAIG